MPYTPYTLQTILTSVRTEEPVPSTNTSTSFFSRRPTSPSTEPPKSPTTRFLPVSIDSVAAWENDLYCGTSDGVILHYTLEDNTSLKKTFSTKLENTINLGLGKKSVVRILLIPQVSKAVVLCDSQLLFFSLPFFDPIPISFIQPIKGVCCFSHDVGEEGRIGQDGTVELVVVKKRTIQVYKIGESMVLKKEIPLQDGALTVTRHNRILCLADSQFYKLVNLQLNLVTPLIPSPSEQFNPSKLLGPTRQSVLNPIAAAISRDEFLMVNGSDEDRTIGIIVDANGEPVRGTLEWSSFPKSVCVEFPYVAALLNNNTIEVHNILDQQLLQQIVLDRGLEAKGMTFGHGIKVWMDVLAAKLRRRPWPEADLDIELESRLQAEIIRYSTTSAHILVYGKGAVLAQVTTPLTVQVDSLLEENRIEEAMQLAEQARNTMSSDSTTYVERLRSELNFTYQKSGLLMLKATVFDDAFVYLSKGEMDPRIVIQMFEGLAQDKWLKESPPVLLFDGVRSLVNELGTIKNIVESSLSDFGNSSEDLTSTSGSPDMERELLTNAREALTSYLYVEREKRKNLLGQNDTICKIIDTSLLKIYITKKDVDLIYRLLQEPNDCVVEDSESTLLKAKKYYALSILYQSKHMYEKVLEIWTKIYTDELPDPEFKDGLNRIKKLLLGNIDPSELPLSVIMHYAWWLTDQSSADGVEVFTKSSRTKDMDPDEILEKLEKYNNDAVKTYLEYLIFTQESEREEYHTRLACTYVKDVQKVINDKNQLEQMKLLVDEFKSQNNPLKISPVEGDGNSFNKSTFVGYLGLQVNQTALVRSRMLLIQLLQNSQLYSPDTLLDVLIKAGPLDIEKVIVYGRMSKHKEALDILIHDLGDFVGAETYCVTNGQSTGIIPNAVDKSKPVSPSNKPLPPIMIEDEYLSPEDLEERRILFTMLFKTYVTIKNSDLMVARTMHLLNTQGFYLDTLEVLKIIPDDWSIDMLQEFLIRSLRRSLDDLNESQIVRGLSLGENLLVNSEMIKLQKEIGPILIDEESGCYRCHRNINNAVFVRDSKNGQLLHLHCAKLFGLVE